MDVIQIVGLVCGVFIFYGIYASWRASLIERSNFLRKLFYDNAETVLNSSIGKPVLQDQIFWMSKNLDNSRVIFSIFRMLFLSKIGVLSSKSNNSRDNIHAELSDSSEKIKEAALVYMCCFVLLHCHNNMLIGAPLRRSLFWKLMRPRTAKNSQILRGNTRTSDSGGNRNFSDTFLGHEKLTEARLQALAVTLHSPPDERAHAA